MSWTPKQFNPKPKHLTLTNVKTNPEIPNLSQNPHVSNPGGSIPLKYSYMIKGESSMVEHRNLAVIHLTTFKGSNILNTTTLNHIQCSHTTDNLHSASCTVRLFLLCGECEISFNRRMKANIWCIIPFNKRWHLLLFIAVICKWRSFRSLKSYRSVTVTELKCQVNPVTPSYLKTEQSRSRNHLWLRVRTEHPCCNWRKQKVDIPMLKAGIAHCSSPLPVEEETGEEVK